MNSKEQIKENLNKIAESHDLTGESVDLIIDLLTYALYHEQIEILSTAKELSLNDAKLINSKIALCCNNMYSVYRGRNPRILIRAKVESQFDKSKFDKLYESNSFKIYSSEPRSINPSDDIVEIEGIISKNSINIITESILYHDQYYIDLKLDKGLLSNLSEDIIVSITSSVDGGKYREYKTTRIFSDHCRSFGDNEMIFVLTIPDYGVRLYKKGKFSKGDIVEVRVIPYTTIDDINESELNKVTIPGTVTQIYDPSTGLKYALINHIPRQDVDSFLYDVNFAGRVNHEIQSNSDVAYLFREVFIDKVTSATYEYISKDKNPDLNSDLLNIYYVDRLLGTPQVSIDGEITDRGKTQIITTQDEEDFIQNYCPYFITGDVHIIRAKEIELVMNVSIVTSDTVSVQQKVDKIMSNYSYKLEVTIITPSIISEISKIDNVKYVKDLTFEGYTNGNDINSGIDSYFTITSNIIFIQDGSLLN